MEPPVANPLAVNRVRQRIREIGGNTDEGVQEYIAEVEEVVDRPLDVMAETTKAKRDRVLAAWAATMSARYPTLDPRLFWSTTRVEGHGEVFLTMRVSTVVVDAVQSC